MRLRLLIEGDFSPEQVENFRAWTDQQRQVMIDPGGDEYRGVIGRFAGAVPVDPDDGHLFPSRPHPGIVGT